MKDGQKQYRILRIDEPDFGCEGRDDGEAAYDKITLVNEQGETCLVRMEEQQVWSMGLDEGMLAWVGKDGQIRGRCKRMDISRWSEKYQVRALTEQDVGAIYELSRKNNLYYEYCPPYVTRDSCQILWRFRPENSPMISITWDFSGERHCLHRWISLPITRSGRWRISDFL